MQTLLNQPNERVVPIELVRGMELGIDILHVLATSLKFSTSNHQSFFLVMCKRITGKGFTNCENGHNTKIKYVNPSYFDFSSFDPAGEMASGGM